MTRNEATEYTRDRLNDHGLTDWKIRLVADLNKNSFLGKCSYKEKVIYLNSHHLDIHPEIDIKNTVNHEVAHALCPGNGHDDVWAAKAKELGCINTSPCSGLALNANAIDAIRSGALLEVDIEERTVREAKYKVTRFIDKCDVCGKIAKELSSKEFRSGKKLFKKITFECGHIRIIEHDSQSAFDLITFDGQDDCKHVWSGTKCIKCDAKKLYPFQIEGARFLEKQNGRAAIFDEMGLGKTVQALSYLKFHPECFPALFIVKSGIKYQWMMEIIRILGEDYFPFVISDGKQGVPSKLKCYVCSYDILRKLDPAKLEKIGLKTVVLDEVQQIKNVDATRTQEVRKLCREIPHIIPLSGTPWKNRGSEFFVVLNMLDPKKFWSYQSFTNNWVDHYWDGSKYKEGGIANPIRFKEHIKDIAIRRERTEVMPELPLINRMRLHVQIEEDARKSYDGEVSDFIKFYNEKVIGGEEDDNDTQMAMVARLQRMRHILGLAKIPATMEFIEEFLDETDRKLVIGVHHKDVGELIYRECLLLGNEQKIEILRITSDMDSAARFEAQQRFNSLPRAIMIVSTLAAGEGLNLQTCSDMVLHERQWNPMNEEQLEGRFIRIGQRAQSVNATYVHADGADSVDIHLDKIVEQKRRQFHVVMNNGSIPAWNEQSIIGELIASLVNSRKK